MAKILRLRRGTAAQHATFTGLEGEITVDTTNDTIRVHDNVTVGGHILASRNYVDNKVADIAAGNINLGNIDINNNTISTVNTNQNLNLDPNGTGYVNVSGNLVISPSSNHISVGNMYIGNSAVIKNTDTTHGLTLIGGPNFVDDTNNTISVIANTFSYAHDSNVGPVLLIGYREPSHFPTQPSTDTVEFQISQNDVSLHIRGYHANNYIHFDHTSQNIGINTFTPDHTFTVRGDLGVRVGNVYASRFSTSNTNQNIELDPNGSGDVVVHADLVPGANSTYNLGSSDYEWNSLYVSSNTIYIGGTPLSVDNSGSILVDGNVYANLGYFKISENTIGTKDGASGWGGHAMFLSPNGEGSGYLYIPRDAEADTEAVSLWNNDAGGVAIGTNNGQIKIFTENQDYIWIFDENGSLTLPKTAVSNTGPKISTVTVSNNGTDYQGVEITPDSEFDVGQGLRIYPTVAEGGHLHITANDPGNIDLFLGDDDHYAKVASSGMVELNGNSVTLWGDGVMASNAYMNLPNNTDSDSVATMISNYGLGGVQIDAGNPVKSWLFGADGILTFPDSTMQTTAFVGTGYLTFDDAAISGTSDYQYTFNTDGYFTSSTSSESPNYFFVTYNSTNLNIAAGWTVVGANCDTTVSSTQYPVAGYPGVIKVTLTSPASGTSGFYPVVVSDPNRLKVQIQPNPGTSDTYTFATTGITFPDTTVQTTAWTGALTIPNSSGLKIDGGTGTIWSGPSGVVQSGDKKGGVYHTASTSNNGLFTFGINGSGVMSTAVEGSIFIGTALPSNNGGVTTAYPGWLVVQNGGKFGADVDTLGNVIIGKGVFEKFQAKQDATGTVEHDCLNGHIFYHTSPDANWTANFTNLNIAASYATTVSIVISQGGTGYYPSAMQIGGVGQTINWQGNATPTPSTNRTDVVTFSILNNAGTYVVLGQLTGF